MQFESNFNPCVHSIKPREKAFERSFVKNLERGSEIVFKIKQISLAFAKTLKIHINPPTNKIEITEEYTLSYNGFVLHFKVFSLFLKVCNRRKSGK